MTAYILRRLLLIIPTMLGIMLVTFVIVQFAPGGPVEKVIAQLTGTDPGATSMFSGGGSDFAHHARVHGGIPDDSPLADLFASRFELWLDERDDITPRREQRRKRRQDVAQRDERDIDRDDIERS